MATPGTVAHQAPLSMGFSRQESWSGVPFPPPGDLPDPGIEARSLHCRQILYSLSHQGGPKQAVVTLLINSYAEHILRNAGLDEAQAGIKIAGRNINKLRYADDTTLMAEGEEELESLLMKVKEESGKTGLKLSIQKTKIVSHHFMANRWGNN